MRTPYLKESLKKKVLRTNLKQSAASITSITPTNATDTDTNETFTVTGTGFTVGTTARFIDTNGKILEFDSVTRNSTTQLTCVIAASKLSAALDPYDIQVTNGEGIATIKLNQVNFKKKFFNLS